MPDRLHDARAEAARGAHKAALKLLWREKTRAAALGDVEILRAVVQLAAEIRDQARGRTAADAFLLGNSANDDLHHAMERRRAAERRPEPRPPAPPRGGSGSATAIAARIDDLESRLRRFEDELLELRALAKAEAARPPEPAETPSRADTVEAEAPVPPVTAEPQPPYWPPPSRPREEPAPAAAATPGEQTPIRQSRVEQPGTGSRGRTTGARPTAVSRSRPSISDLIGARALAFAGGVVTLLGVIFFFVLAVNRGWVSPELRVLLGAATSVALYGIAVLARHRYGNLQAALGAAGAGIGGAYATLVAATVLYDFVSEEAALLAAAGVAAVGVATALSWNVQLTAALGLAGAMAGPLLIELPPTALGTTFVAVLLAAAVAVTLLRRWLATRITAGVVSAVAILLLLVDRDAGEDATVAVLVGIFALLYLAAALGERLVPPRLGVGGVVATGFVAASAALVAILVLSLEPTSPAAVAGVVAALWLVYLAAGVGLQLGTRRAELDRIAVALVLASVSIGYGASHGLFERDWVEGVALLVVAGVTAAPLALLRGRDQRNLASVLWAAALSVTAVAGGYLLTGERLALVWAAQGALVSWVAVRAREPRLQLAAVAYLLIALRETLLVEAPPIDLFTAIPSPGGAIPAVVFVSLAAGAFALAYRRQPGAESRPVFRGLAFPSQREGSGTAALASGALALYAASFALLALFQLVFDDAGVRSAFERGHAAITSLWGLAALALMVAGLARRFAALHWAGVGLFAATLMKVVAFDATSLSPTNASFAVLAFAVLALAGGFAYGILGGRIWPATIAPTALHPLTVAFVAVSVLGAVPALVELLDGTTWGIDRQGGGLVLAAAVYAGLAGLVFGRAALRDVATLLWAVAAALAAGGIAYDLLDGRWVVLAWAVAGAALAVLAGRLREDRLLVASLAYVASALAYALVFEAPPTDLLLETARPAAGVPSLVFGALAAFVLAASLRSEWRSRALWIAGGVSVYAASLAVLGFFQLIRFDEGQSVATAFQRGHTAVSALWGLIGLFVLAVGLRRGWTAFRLAGLALFGVALAKIFLFDLRTLSSMARALSFLAVGSVLLLAAFVYQRLTEADEEDEGATPAGRSG